MDAQIAEPVGAGHQERLLMHKEARRIEEQVFPKLVNILNDFHGIERDQRYWRIFLGHWLRDIVQLLLNRVMTIKKCLENHEVCSVTIASYRGLTLAPTDYADLWTKSDQDSWNSEIFAQIFRKLNFPETKIEYLLDELDGNRLESGGSVKLIQSLKPRRVIDEIARKIASVLQRDRDAFVINSYLPPEKELLLNFSLCQFPQRRVTERYKITATVEKEIRAELAKKLQPATDTSVEGIIVSFLFDLIPMSCLEGYRSLLEASELTSWPKQPKFIFTSLNFKADELFKIWTAEKVNKGTPYFVGQHGMGYGTHKFYELSVEETSADRFFTWGWKLNQQQHVPAFIFKNSSNSRARDRARNGLLLIETTPYARFEVWEQADEFEKYMEEQFNFVSHLAVPVRDELLVRLHPGYAINSGEGDLRWLNYNPDIKLDLGQVPIRKLWSKSKLMVHSYDSTGLLETLEADRPTIAFWQDGLNHLVDEAIPYYQLLISAGIVHLTPESAAAKINDIWADVDKWWASHEIQNAREIFCEKYARTSKKPVRQLKKLLLEEI